MNKEEKDLEEIEKVVELNNVLDRLEENDKIYNDKILAEVAIIKELKYQRFQNAKDRKLGRNLLLTLVTLLVVVLISLVGITRIALDNRHNIKSVDSTLVQSQKSYQILIDCTTPSHPCYDNAVKQGNNQLGDALQKNQDYNKIAFDLQNQKFIMDLQALLNAINHNQSVITPPITPTTTTTIK